MYLIFLLILSTTSNKTIKNEQKYFTRINKINVTGLSVNDNLQITNKLNNLFYKNILIIGKKEIKKIISEFNIIEEYNIKKIYPSKLNISIKPTKIIAKISGNKELLVGSNGKLITAEITDKTLPYVFGEFDSIKFLNFKEKIEHSKFNFIDLKSIFFYPSNRWDILTNNNILIKLSEDDMSESLNLAHKIVNDNQFHDNKLIDLRVSNHLIIN